MEKLFYLPIFCNFFLKKNKFNQIQEELFNPGFQMLTLMISKSESNDNALEKKVFVHKRAQ